MSSRPVAVITGAASGIGLATAERLAERGDHVVMLDREPVSLAEATAAVRDRDGSVSSYVVDVRDGPTLLGICGSIAETYGPIRWLHSNAGGGRPRPAIDLSLVEWQTLIDVHVTGAHNLCRAALPHMTDGAILFTASDFAIVGYPGYAHYCAAKAALYAMAKSLALELAPSIRVNCIGPGPIDTPHLRGVADAPWEEARLRFEQEVPMGRLGRPDEVAAVAGFLLSDRAGYVTGQIVHPNGGQVMW